MSLESKLSRRRLFKVAAVGAASVLLPVGTVAAQGREPHFIFAHGWQGAGTKSKDRDNTWVDSVKDFTQANGISADYPHFEGGPTPQARVWMKKLRDEIIPINSQNKGIFLLGYSLGATTAMLFIDACLRGESEYDKKMLGRLAAIIFIAPLSNDVTNAQRRGGAYSSFFDYPVDTAAIARAVPIRRVLHSLDDPQVPFAHGEELALQLEANLITVDGSGHFTTREDGEVILPVLDEVLRTYRG